MSHGLRSISGSLAMLAAADTPKNLDEVRTCLGGCPAEMEVEVERGIPLTANTVAELRVLPAWPPGDWVLDVPVDGDQRYNVVRVEWRSYTSL